MEGGRVFAKAGVNVAVVHGAMRAEEIQAATGHTGGAGQPREFFATGVSAVLHPCNPMVPGVHANFRYFELGGGRKPGSWWFGGGADLTPCYLFDEDVTHFHGRLKEVCDRHDLSFYPRFKKWCDDYFYIPHRSEHRGVGGIFFDRLNDRDPADLLAFVSACADAFLPSYLPIVEARKDAPFADAHKRWQAYRWGRYVEFNLVCDRGTAFGLRSGGRTGSVLMSLPPVASWVSGHEPAPGTEEARLAAVLRRPRQWA
jgi:coproporphyrinogen III oxidase